MKKDKFLEAVGRTTTDIVQGTGLDEYVIDGKGVIRDLKDKADEVHQLVYDNDDDIIDTALVRVTLSDMQEMIDGIDQVCLEAERD